MVQLRPNTANGVTGQIFGTRMHEVYLFGSPRPIRVIAQQEGWTPESIAELAMPALEAGFMPLDTSDQCFDWNPI